MSKTYAVIMAGGSGTRFWPMSRKTRPKQLLSLLTERSLLAETIARIAPSQMPHEHVLIVTGRALAAPIDELVLGTGARVVVEPRARNTAPCIALAAALVAEDDPTAVMAVLPADQTIVAISEFRRVFAQASRLAAEGRIVTLGIRPTHPETGYGYIRRGPSITSDVFEVGAFVEKPNLETAEQYLASGDFDWNSGMFFMRADVLLEAVDRHLPGLSKGIADYRRARGTADEAAALEACFELAEPISIDFGIMEKETARIAVIPADIGWSDVGSWRTLLDFRDGEENFVRGDVTLRDVTGSVVISTGPHVAVIGVSGISVVATGDAVLVAPIDRSQDVGAIPKALEVQGRKELV
jgi:mannose-1-phosphate guanylyltransferase